MQPVGLEYFGTHQMQRMAGSLATRSSTTFMSGPSSVMGTLASSKPTASARVKWRS